MEIFLTPATALDVGNIKSGIGDEKVSFSTATGCSCEKIDKATIAKVFVFIKLIFKDFEVKILTG